MQHLDLGKIKVELRLRFPRYEFDHVEMCYNIWWDENALDWHSGDNPQLKQSFFSLNSEWNSIVMGCKLRARHLWQGQSCVRILCICDQSRHCKLHASPSIVVSSTLQAVFQHEGYNSIGPLELVSVGLSSSATYAGSASHTCSVEVEEGMRVICPLADY